MPILYKTNLKAILSVKQSTLTNEKTLILISNYYKSTKKNVLGPHTNYYKSTKKNVLGPHCMKNFYFINVVKLFLI